jgi:hypothetical protein
MVDRENNDPSPGFTSVDKMFSQSQVLQPFAVLATGVFIV